MGSGCSKNRQITGAIAVYCNEDEFAATVASALLPTRALIPLVPGQFNCSLYQQMSRLFLGRHNVFHRSFSVSNTTRSLWRSLILHVSEKINQPWTVWSKWEGSSIISDQATTMRHLAPGVSAVSYQIKCACHWYLISTVIHLCLYFRELKTYNPVKKDRLETIRFDKTINIHLFSHRKCFTDGSIQMGKTFHQELFVTLIFWWSHWLHPSTMTIESTIERGQEIKKRRF